MTQTKLRLRMPPSPEALNDQQSAAARLLKLDKWTEEPLNPPPSGVAASIVLPLEASLAGSESVTKAKPALEARKMPWELPGSDAPHPYHIVSSEGLFQKMDYVWKRNGSRSMRMWVLSVLEAEADRQLKQLGKIGPK